MNTNARVQRALAIALVAVITAGTAALVAGIGILTRENRRS